MLFNIALYFFYHIIIFSTNNYVIVDANGETIYDGLDESYRSIHDNVTETEAMLEASQRSQLSEPLHPQTLVNFILFRFAFL